MWLKKQNTSFKKFSPASKKNKKNKENVPILSSWLNTEQSICETMKQSITTKKIKCLLLPPVVHHDQAEMTTTKVRRHKIQPPHLVEVIYVCMVSFSLNGVACQRRGSLDVL